MASVAPLICHSREEWLHHRGPRIGATDAAALLGLSKYKNAFELWHQKKGLMEQVEGERFARNLGLLLEDPIAELYRQETHRLAFRPLPGQHLLYSDPDEPDLVATLDGSTATLDHAPAPARQFIFDDDNALLGVLEIKTAGFTKREQWLQDPPLEYVIQVQHQMMVTGAKWASIPALVAGMFFVYADIQRDDGFIAELRKTELDFLRSLRENERPPVDGSEITKDTIKRLLPKETLATPAVLPPEALEWDAQRMQAKREIDDAMARVNEAEGNLRLAIGEHAGSGLLPNGVRYTLKTISKKPYTVTPKPYRELRRFAPKDHAQHTPSEAPRLTLADDDVDSEVGF